MNIYEVKIVDVFENEVEMIEVEACDLEDARDIVSKDLEAGFYVGDVVFGLNI